MVLWNVIDVGFFLKYYEVQKEVGDEILPSLVNSYACKREFYFNLFQIAKEWWIVMIKHSKIFGPW